MSKCGFAAIVGSPNVGKSTLLNHLLGFKLSITSSKPQTTRHRLLGVETIENNQIIYVDTPGLHKEAKKALNKYLNKAAKSALQAIDVIVFVVDCQRWDEDDEWVLTLLQKTTAPIILVVNKIDKLTDRTQLLPLIEKLNQRIKSEAIIPLSALKGDQVDDLRQEIIKFLPEGPFHFPAEQVSNRNEQFLATEIVREKLMRSLEKELPYGLTVTIEAFAEEEDLVRISAVIWTERDSHKPIIIGKQGSQLKKIGKLARTDLERLFAKQVYLQLWVRVKSGWSDNEKILKQFGYEE